MLSQRSIVSGIICRTKCLHAAGGNVQHLRALRPLHVLLLNVTKEASRMQSNALRPLHMLLLSYDDGLLSAVKHILFSDKLQQTSAPHFF